MFTYLPVAIFLPYALILISTFRSVHYMSGMIVIDKSFGFSLCLYSIFTLFQVVNFFRCFFNHDLDARYSHLRSAGMGPQMPRRGLLQGHHVHLVWPKLEGMKLILQEPPRQEHLQTRVLRSPSGGAQLPRQSCNQHILFAMFLTLAFYLFEK